MVINLVGRSTSVPYQELTAILGFRGDCGRVSSCVYLGNCRYFFMRCNRHDRLHDDDDNYKLCPPGHRGAGAIEWRYAYVFWLLTYLCNCGHYPIRTKSILTGDWRSRTVGIPVRAFLPSEILFCCVFWSYTRSALLAVHLVGTVRPSWPTPQNSSQSCNDMTYPRRISSIYGSSFGSSTLPGAQINTHTMGFRPNWPMP